MKVFQTLQDLINYIPNCIICGKERVLSIEGYLNAVSSSKPKWGSGNTHISLQLEFKDGILRSKHKNHSVAIEAKTNKLIDGEDIVNRLMLQTINVKKICRTCVFISQAVYQDGNIKKLIAFRPLHYEARN